MTEKELIQTKEPETDTIPNTTIVSSTTKGSNQNTDMTSISTTTTRTSTPETEAIATTQRKTESMNTAVGTTVTPLQNDIPNNVKVRSHKKSLKMF